METVKRYSARVAGIFLPFVLLSCQMESVSSVPPVYTQPIVEETPIAKQKWLLNEPPRWCQSDRLEQCTNPERVKFDIQQAGLTDATRFHKDTDIVLTADRVDAIAQQKVWQQEGSQWALVESRLISLLAGGASRAFVDWLAFQQSFINDNSELEALWLGLGAAEIDSFSVLRAEDTSVHLALNTDTLSDMNKLASLQALTVDFYQAWQTAVMALYSDADDAPRYTEAEFNEQLATLLVTESHVNVNGKQLYQQWLSDDAKSFIISSLTDSDQALTINPARIDEIAATKGDAKWGESSETDYLSDDTLEDTLQVLKSLLGTAENRRFADVNRFADSFSNTFLTYVDEVEQYIETTPRFSTGLELWNLFTSDLQRQILATLMVGAEQPKQIIYADVKKTKPSAANERLQTLIESLPSASPWLYITAAHPRQLRQADDLSKQFASLAVSAQWLPFDTALSQARLDQNCNALLAYEAVQSDQLIDLLHYPEKLEQLKDACLTPSKNIDLIDRAEVIYIDAGEWVRLMNAFSPETESGLTVPSYEWVRIQERVQANEVHVVVFEGFDVFADNTFE